MTHVRTLSVSILLALPAAAQHACPPASHYDGFHDENVGTSLAAVGDAALFGHASGGSVGFFERTPWEYWTRTALVSSPLEPESFGGPLALTANYALIGDPRDETFPVGSSGHGAAVLYDRVGSDFEVAAELLPPVPETLHRFGSAVAISPDENWVLVGAHFQGDGIGAAYFYDAASGWELHSEVAPASSAADDFFGAAVALDDEWAFVSATFFLGYNPGRVFVFHLEDDVWTEVGVLDSDDDTAVSNFGTVLDFEGGKLFVGSPSEPNEDGSTGAAYVFEYDGSDWVETTRLTAGASDATRFGQALDASGDRLAVGASRRVVAFEHGEGGWVPLDVIDDPSDSTSSDFGEAVAWYSDGLLVGAGNFDGNGFKYPDDTGAVMSFDMTGAGQPLRACRGAASITTPILGNTVELLLEAPSEAGRDYFILGSITGEGPLALGPVLLPLTPDPYFALTVGGSPSLPNGFGTLDGEGRAEAQFVFPEGSGPNLVGLRTRHAFLTLNEGGNPAFASNVVQIRLLD